MNESTNLSHAKPKFPTISNFWLVMLALVLVMGIVGLIVTLLLPNNRDLSFLLGYSIPLILVCLVMIMFQRHESGVGFRSLFGKFKISIVPYLLLFVLGYGYFGDFLSNLIPMPKSMEELFMNSFQLTILGFISVCVMAPVLEEVLFRGILMRSFLQNYSPRKAILWSAIFFAIIHLNPWQGIPAFGLGLFMAWLFYKTGSLLPCILVHFMNNLAAFVAMMVYGVQASTTEMLGWRLSLIIAAAGLALAAYSFYQVRRALRKGDSEVQ